MSKKNRHWFRFFPSGIFFLFFSIMVYVTYIAFSRHSGSTHLDMAKMQKIRYDLAIQKETVRD